MSESNMVPLWICIVLVVIILAMAAFYYYSQYYVKNVLQRDMMKDLEDRGSVTPSPYVKDATSDAEAQSFITGDGTVKIILLHAQWCGHCRNMMNSFVSAAASSDKSITWHRVDANVSPSLVRRDDVKGFPTVFGVMASGQLKLHVGGRDEASLTAFAKSLVVAAKPAEQPEVVMVEENKLPEEEKVVDEPEQKEEE